MKLSNLICDIIGNKVNIYTLSKKLFLNTHFSVQKQKSDNRVFMP